MTPKTLLSAIVLMTSLFAHAQLQAASGKLFIINDSQRSALTESANPIATLSQTDRLELTTTEQLVNVKRCGPFGCLDPMGQSVRMEAIKALNTSIQAEDLERKDKDLCRVCIPAKTIQIHLEDYVDRLKTVAPQFER